MAKQLCVSCKTDISVVKGSTKFDCPSCEKAAIARCGKCRKIATKYKCTECTFTGP